MLAAIKGNAEMARILIENKAQVNDKDKDGRNSLMFAAIADRAEVARVLIEADAHLREQDNSGRNALMFAAEGGNVNFMRVLIDTFKERERKAQEAQARRGRIGQLAGAILSGSGSPLDDLMVNGMAFHTTALCLAARNGKIEAADMLLAAGAHIDYGAHGEYPVMHAVRGGHLEMVKFLVEKNTRLDSDFRGNTPLALAKELGKHEIAEYLERAINKRSAEPKNRGAWNPDW
jgi:ankyrin repeat protein